MPATTVMTESAAVATPTTMFRATSSFRLRTSAASSSVKAGMRSCHADTQAGRVNLIQSCWLRS